MAIFTGAGVALVTPFKENKEVDYDQLEKLVDYQIENGSDSIIVCGTTGEASTLTHEEHLECIKVVADRTKKRVPVIAGTGSNCTETAIFLSKEAKSHGSDGLLVVTPYYNKATQNGLIEHFTAIAQSVDIPVIMYNVPGRTGCNLLPKTVVKLAKEVDNIIAIKEASGNISQVASLMALAEGCIDMYSGNDDQIIPILSLGGKGVISVLSNIMPRETHDIVSKYISGETNESLKLQLKLLPLIDALFCEVNPIPIKEAVALMGLASGYIRRPLTPLEPENRERLIKEMQAVGILKS